MRYTHGVLRSLSIIAATLLAACAGSSSPGGRMLPSGAYAAASVGGMSPQSIDKKGGGVFGVGYDDVAHIPYGSDKVDCTGPPSNCFASVPQHKLKDAVSNSNSYGSASVTASTALGALDASTKAVSVQAGPSAVASANVDWEDTFTITSKTLAPGTPVSVQATIVVKAKHLSCGAASYEQINIGTGYSGLSFSEDCTNSPPPVLTATLNSSVGAQFTESVILGLYLQVGNFSFGGQASSGPVKVGYHFAVLTQGATYITASGKKYP